jgi:flagellar L-ring protein precursor FlgH
MTKIIKIGVCVVALFLAGCTTPMDPEINMKPPKYVAQMPSKEVVQTHNLGSLYGTGDNLFSDKKARRVNDIVTVVITEQVKASSTGKAQTSESTTTPMSGVNMLVGAVNHVTGMAGLSVGANKLSDSTVARSYQGQGTNTREDTFSTTITARIIKVLANGDYFIAGSREALIDGEKNIIRICGVIRPSDIDSTNTIDSKYIADAKIEFKTEGEIQRATDKNWFAKFLDAISPY